MKEYKVGSLFAGVGGICLGFQNAKSDNAKYRLLWANEIDEYACATYKNNFKHTLLQGDIKLVAGAMGNVLESVTIPMHPVIEVIKNEMKAAGALNAMMSGSGPTVFGIFTSRGKAKAAAARLKRQTPVKQAYVTNVHNVRRK